MNITSTFDSDTDGWGVAGLGYGPTFVSDGAGGGFIRISDAGGDDFYFKAPDKFLGDKGAFYGGTLSFELRQSGGWQYDAVKDVILRSGSGVTIYASIANPGLSFTGYSIPLSSLGGWKLSNGEAATDAQIFAVLSDLAELLIIGEFVWGGESNDLDNVVMAAGAAVHRFESDPGSGNPGGIFAHDSLAEALGAASPGQWIVVNDPASPGGVQTVAVDGLHISAPAGYAALLLLDPGVTSLTLGGSGFFQVAGNAAANVLRANDAGSALSGNAGNDSLHGGAGDDSLDGGRDRDSIWGGAGNDSINGGSHNDSLYGEAGNDTLDGGSGNDRLDGGDGNDVLTDLVGSNRLIGGAGNDTLTAGDGADVLYGGAQADRLYGGGGNDTLDGGGGNDRLFGEAGNDMLRGGIGNDILDGGAGNDTLRAGPGNDTLTGGSGADVFEFVRGTAEGSDVVTDFENGLDLIRIAGGSFAELTLASANGGLDTQIVTPWGTTILLQGVASGTLDAGDFVFV